MQWRHRRRIPNAASKLSMMVKRGENAAGFYKGRWKALRVGQRPLLQKGKNCCMRDPQQNTPLLARKFSS
jgi:hypothetical protein